MFTGIIEELGTVIGWERPGDSGRLSVRAETCVRVGRTRRSDW